MFKWLTCGLLFFAILYVNGQQEVIDTIVVSSTSIRSDNFGGETITIPDEQPSLLSRSLNNSAQVFIKNYGPGSIATSSIRGGSAGHTLILWNGLPIQNPFLGLLDLSLLDTWAMTDVEVQKGGNSALWGSGAIGGVINLKQLNKVQNTFNFQNQLVFGSFGKLEEKAKLSVAKGKIASVSSFSYLRAKNNFTYKIGPDLIKVQTNALQKQYTINQDLYYNLNDHNELTFHYWRSRADRQIPPTTVQSKSEAFQHDAADRFSMIWKNFQEKSATKLRTGYFIEDLNYYDPSQTIASITHFTTLLADIEREYRFSKQHKIIFGISYFNTRVDSPANYANNVIENKSSIFLSYQYRWLLLSARQEYVNESSIPLTPALAFELPEWKNLTLKGRISKNYRLPTLNDRFWQPGGNPELRPESGWSEELNLSYDRDNGPYFWGAGLTGFNRVISNWILWTLDGPLNISQVWSRGIETNGSFTVQKNNYSIGMSIAYNYVLSTNQKSIQFPKIQVGDQLYYTPVHQLNNGLHLKFREAQLNYFHQFTGMTRGINDNLDSFQTGDLSLSYALEHIVLKLQVLNLWNENYRIIERRPMPGRHFEIVINYKLK